MTVWFVASQNPGTSSFLESSLVAVNFWVRGSAHALDERGIKAIATGGHVEWDRKTPGVKTNFARQLVQFASGLEESDDVISFDPARRDVILVGKVAGPYAYEDLPTIPDHPHVLPVDWVGTVAREKLPEAGASIVHTRGITVKRVSGGSVAKPTPLDDAPPAPDRSPGSSTPTSRATADSFAWAPDTGPHRYVLHQWFDGNRPMRRPFVVVMLNPAANHLPGFRRSTTCHAVRRWGQAHGYDGAVYVNLFSHIEPNSARLRDIAAGDLNGPGADEAIEEVGRSVEAIAIAGWGDLPPGLSRPRYNARVVDVERLMGRPLLCLGFTRGGYPRHGRGWRTTDETVSLRP